MYTIVHKMPFNLKFKGSVMPNVILLAAREDVISLHREVILLAFTGLDVGLTHSAR